MMSFLRDERGNILIVAGLVTPSLFGVGAFVIWFGLLARGLPRFREESRKAERASLRRPLSHSAQPIELSRDNPVGEAAMRVGKALQQFELSHDAAVGFMLAGAGEAPGEFQDLCSLAL